MLLARVKGFLLDIIAERDLLFELAKRDIQKQYMGSYLGFVWVYFEPLLFMSVLYFTFSVGFKSGGRIHGVPFIVYLISGMVPWYYLAGNLGAMNNVITQHSFLLKKVDFRLSLLPIVKLMSSAVPHLFLLLIAFAAAAINNIYPSIHALQLLYYFFSMVVLLLGLGWLTSSTKVFVPDVSKIVNLLVTFGFWLTPIFWDIGRIPKKFRWILELNPAVYIVQGYRDAIVNHAWFWEKPYETLYYWTFTMSVLLVGITVFKRLRPHFAEVI